MALLERVSTLLRANINDLLSKAEDPEKLARQLLLDMENQLVQVKTQVAMAIADQHLLEKKRKEQETAQAQYIRKAELAVSKGQDELARTALERALSHQQMAEALAQQHADQLEETETLRSAFSRLQQKLAETQTRVDLLMTQLRRNRVTEKARTAKSMLGDGSAQSRLRKLSEKVEENGAQNYTARTLMALAVSESAEDKLESLQRNEQVEGLLLELKERQLRLQEGG